MTSVRSYTAQHIRFRGAEIPATDNEESFHCQLVTIAYVLWRGVSCDDGNNDDDAVK